MNRLRVLAAMSGGVDSAVAAARAAEAGHDVTGVHLALSANPASYRSGARGCCTLEDARDARRAADVIGIPFYVWDMAERFREDVVRDFVEEYARGNTPNPCLRCNEKIKFAAVLDRAVALGFDVVCTGHHARLAPAWRQGGAPRLARSVDAAKDQSYVLAVLTSEQLGRAMFPLGGCTKDEVRREAAARVLAVADKPDSHDVCFIADGDTRKFLRGQLGEAPGQIVDEAGAVLGGHDGAYGFTVGQRRGCGSATRRRTAGRGTSWTSPRRPARSWSARPNRSTCARSRRGARYGPAARRPPGRSAAWSSSARTAPPTRPLPGRTARACGSRWARQPAASPAARRRSCTTAIPSSARRRSPAPTGPRAQPSPPWITPDLLPASSGPAGPALLGSAR